MSEIRRKWLMESTKRVVESMKNLKLIKDVSNVDIAKCERCKNTLLIVLYDSGHYHCRFCGAGEEYITNPFKKIEWRK